MGQAKPLTDSALKKSILNWLDANPNGTNRGMALRKLAQFTLEPADRLLVLARLLEDEGKVVLSNDGFTIRRCRKKPTISRRPKPKTTTPPPPPTKAAKKAESAKKTESPKKPTDTEIASNPTANRFIEVMPGKIDDHKERVYEAKVEFMKLTDPEGGGIDPNTIIIAALRYRASRPPDKKDPQRKYTLSPFQWLKQRRWHDTFGEDDGEGITITPTGKLYEDEVWKHVLGYLGSRFGVDEIQTAFQGIALDEIGVDAHLTATGDNMAAAVDTIDKYTDDLDRAFYLITGNWRMPTLAPKPKPKTKSKPKRESPQRKQNKQLSQPKPKKKAKRSK